MRKLFLTLMTIVAIALTGCKTQTGSVSEPTEPLAPENTDAIDKVSGVVVDELGDPLLAVMVVVKGTPLGTVTNETGYYSINAHYGDVLVFSFPGYPSQSIKVTSNTINVKMEPDDDLDVKVVR